MMGNWERIIVLEIGNCDGLDDNPAKSSIDASIFSNDMSDEVIEGAEESIILKKHSKSSNDAASDETMDGSVEWSSIDCCMSIIDDVDA